MSKDLLIYTTIANRADNIKFSVLFDHKTKESSFPSLVTFHNDEEKWYADNNLFLIHELLPALKAHQSRTMTDEQSEIINAIWFPAFKNESIWEMIDILEYAIENNLLTETM